MAEDGLKCIVLAKLANFGIRYGLIIGITNVAAKYLIKDNIK